MRNRHPSSTATLPRPAIAADAAAPWPPLTRIVFRVSVLYLGLFALATQISGSLLPNPWYYYRGLGRLPPMREITVWVGSLFGLTLSPADASIAGEPPFFWVQTAWLLVVALVAAGVWTIRARRVEYSRLHAWFRLFVRLAMAAALFEYGMTKVIPTQFPAPTLEMLVTRVGDLSLSALLWTSIGASPAYEVFTGCIELLAGLLLLAPRTTLLGALLGLGAMTQVFLLNVTYDIGLKLVSFHLMLLAVFLIAPDARRLTDVFLRDRAVPPADFYPVARTPSGARTVQTATLLFGACLLGVYTYSNVAFWRTEGGGAPKSPLYGIWTVESLSVDGEARPPELNDYDRRWRLVIFDAPDRMVFQRTDDSFARYGASIDEGARRITLSKGGSRTWRSTFEYQRRAGDRLALDGQMDGHAIAMELRRVDFDTLRLLNSTFRWVRPHGSSAGGLAAD